MHVARGDVYDVDFGIADEVAIVAVRLGTESAVALRSAEAWVLAARATTSTQPSRRRDSMCTGPMKPVPTTAAPSWDTVLLLG